MALAPCAHGLSVAVHGEVVQVEDARLAPVAAAVLEIRLRGRLRLWVGRRRRRQGRRHLCYELGYLDRSGGASRPAECRRVTIRMLVLPRRIASGTGRLIARSPEVFVPATTSLARESSTALPQSPEMVQEHLAARRSKPRSIPSSCCPRDRACARRTAWRCCVEGNEQSSRFRRLVAGPPAGNGAGRMRGLRRGDGSANSKPP